VSYKTFCTRPILNQNTGNMYPFSSTRFEKRNKPYLVGIYHYKCQITRIMVYNLFTVHVIPTSLVR